MASALIVVTLLLADAQLALLERSVGRFGWYAPLLAPLHVAVFVMVFARSAYRTVFRRSVTWKGRAIAVGHSGS